MTYKAGRWRGIKKGAGGLEIVNWEQGAQHNLWGNWKKNLWEPLEHFLLEENFIREQGYKLLGSREKEKIQESKREKMKWTRGKIWREHGEGGKIRKEQGHRNSPYRASLVNKRSWVRKSNDFLHLLPQEASKNWCLEHCKWYFNNMWYSKTQ